MNGGSPATPSHPIAAESADASHAAASAGHGPAG